MVGIGRTREMRRDGDGERGDERRSRERKDEGRLGGSGMGEIRLGL